MTFNPYPDYDCIKCGQRSSKSVCDSCQKESTEAIERDMRYLELKLREALRPIIEKEIELAKAHVRLN